MRKPNSLVRYASSWTRAYSMTDLGRELGITRQAVYDLLRRAEQESGK
jgi:predicted DNA-binding protein YlxM (UPF0122 family)